MKIANRETTMGICAKVLMMVTLISELHGKCQAVSRKELPNKKCLPED